MICYGAVNPQHVHIRQHMVILDLHTKTPTPEWYRATNVTNFTPKSTKITSFGLEKDLFSIEFYNLTNLKALHWNFAINSDPVLTIFVGKLFR